MPMKTTRRTRRTTAIAALALAAMAPAALAQYEITIDVENPTLLPGESTTVTMYAGFDPSLWAMARVQTDLVTSVGSEGWSDVEVPEPMDVAGHRAGSASATGFDRIIAGQIQFEGAGIAADPINPAPFWQATYTAPIDATEPLDIQLTTFTSDYDVFEQIFIEYTVSGLPGLTEGSATIRVIPAPASALVLAGGLLAMRRRR